MTSLMKLTTALCVLNCIAHESLAQDYPEVGLSSSIQAIESTPVLVPIEVTEINDLHHTSSTEIIAKSLAYGLIRGTIEETCTSFENVLYNFLVTKGSQGTEQLFEMIGGKAGDLVAKKAMNMSIQLLLDAASGPVAAPSTVLKMTNALTILDGLVVKLIFNRLQQKIYHLKSDISNKVAQKTATTLYNIFKPYAAEDTSKALLSQGAALVEFSTSLLVQRALDKATDEIQRTAYDYVINFIKTSPLTQDYEQIVIPLFDFLTVGSGCQLHDVTQLYILSNHPLSKTKDAIDKAIKEEAQKRLIFLHNLGRSIGAVVGQQTGRVVGSYLFYEAADRFIDGIGSKISQRILSSSEFLTTLQKYSEIPIDTYQKIINQEVESKCRLKEEAKRRIDQEAMNRQQVEAIREDFQQMIEAEHQYEEAYINYHIQKDQGLFHSCVISPMASMTGNLWSGMTWGAHTIANGAGSVVEASRDIVSTTQEFISCWYDWAVINTYKQMTPALACSIGGNLAQGVVQTAFVNALVKQKFTHKDALTFLSTKIAKDRYYAIGKYTWVAGKWVAQGALDLHQAVVNLPGTINAEINEAADKKWLSPFYPED